MNNIKVQTKMIMVILATMAALVLCTIFSAQSMMELQSRALETMETDERDSYDEQIKQQVDNVISLCQTIYDQYQEGVYTEAEAKKLAADEIRQLAESTKSTVGQIQEINQMVIEAVNELANNANNMVEYTNTRILPDYESFVTASRQYQTDAKYINDKMNGFSEKSDNLKTEMEKMGTSMENISRIIAESSTGVSNAARSAADLVDEMGSVNKEMIVNQEITADLRGETDKFIAIE